MEHHSTSSHSSQAEMNRVYRMNNALLVAIVAVCVLGVAFAIGLTTVAGQALGVISLVLLAAATFVLPPASWLWFARGLVMTAVTIVGSVYLVAVVFH